MTKTLEQELQDVIENGDYFVRISVTSYTHVSVHYRPARVAVDMGGKIPVVVNDGEIGCKLFAGPARWRYWRARRYVRRIVAGHRALVAEGFIVR